MKKKSPNKYILTTNLQEILGFSPVEIIDSSVNSTIDDIIKMESISRNITSCVEISEWKVHYLYKMTDIWGKNIILKIRRDHLYAKKLIKKNPWDIKYEAKIYKIFKDYWITPRLIKFNKQEHYILLEYLEGVHLKDVIDNIDEELIKKIVNVLIIFHNKSQLSFIRNRKKENQIYKNQLFYRFWFLKDPKISELLLKMYNKRNGIIHWDLNPFNILLTKDSFSVNLIDLETTHYGNIEFDIWYFIAHLLIFMWDHERMRYIINRFFKLYQTEVELDEDMIVKIIASTLFYRLKSEFSYWEWKKQKYMQSIANKIFSWDINTIKSFQCLI